VKTGKEFEELIFHIQTCLAQQAKVEPNMQLPDKDTGQTRQIDILVSVSDGPYLWRTIVEVRDHIRPVGVEYVDAMNNKKTSVGANMAAIVSKSGFTKPASTKAQSLGIRAFTYKEAITSTWANWMLMKSFTIMNQRYALSGLDLRLSQEVYDANKDDIDAIDINIKPSDVIFAIGDQKNPTNFDTILRGSSIFQNLWDGVTPNGPSLTKNIRLIPEIPLYLMISKNENYLPLSYIDTSLILNLEKSDNPLVYSALTSENGSSIMDVLSAKKVINGKEFELQMMTNGGKQVIEPGQKIHFRTQEGAIVQMVKKEIDK
jgi:hypothetical protein